MGYRAMVGFGSVMLVCGMPAGGASGAEGREALSIRVELTDLAGLPPDAVAWATDEATGIFQAAGLNVTWQAASGDDDRAERQPAPVKVRLVILSGSVSEAMCKRAGLDAAAMGVALTGPDLRDAGMAWVFYDRIEEAALARGSAPLRGLAHVMAHEVGHVLLGTNGHAARGLMQAEWNPAATTFETFRPAEVERIRARFGRDD